MSGPPVLFSPGPALKGLAPIQKGQVSKHCLPWSVTCIQAMSPPTHVTQESANKTGLKTCTSEVSSNALFFSLRCCQHYNPVGIHQPALSASHGESDVLGFALLAPQRIVTISTADPKHRTLQGSV